MDTSLFNGKSLELVIMLDMKGAGRCGRFDTLPPSGAIAVGKLSYGRNSFLLIFRSFFYSHCSESAQIIPLHGERSASRLELTCRAMLVQYEWRLHSLAERSDRLDDLFCLCEIVGGFDIPDTLVFTGNDFPA